MQSNCMADYFDQMADVWDTHCHHDKRKIQTIINLADIQTDMRILDVATGTGVLIPYLLDKQPAQITGIDLSEKMIARAKQKHTNDKVLFLQQDLYTFQPEISYDLIMIYSAYPHFQDRVRFSQQIAALLKEGGRFMIAHSESKEIINGRHQGEQVQQVSSTLLSVAEEACYFKKKFKVDIMVDTDAYFILSGVKA